MIPLVNDLCGWQVWTLGDFSKVKIVWPMYKSSYELWKKKSLQELFMIQFNLCDYNPGLQSCKLMSIHMLGSERLSTKKLFTHSQLPLPANWISPWHWFLLSPTHASLQNPCWLQHITVSTSQHYFMFIQQRFPEFAVSDSSSPLGQQILNGVGVTDLCFKQE